MTSYTRTISEGTGGYVGSGYVTTGYITAQTTMQASVNGQLAALRTITPTVTITGIIANLGIGRNLTQTITASHSISRLLHAIREITTGSGGYTGSGYLESGYLTANITDITDTISRVRNVPRTLTETITNTNQVARLYAALRTISQSPLISDSLNRLYDALRTISPTVTITDNISRLLVALRTITQNVTITSLFNTFKGIAGTGARRIKTATASIFKRSGITTIFKRSANTTT